MSAPVLAPVVFLDREGDAWRVGDRTPGGDVLMVCDNPQNPDDRGPGESFPWTRRTVEMYFGPLVPADVAVAS